MEIAQSIGLRNLAFMIYDTLENAERYASLLPGLDMAFAFLRSLTPKQPTGKVVLEEERLYAGIDRYVTKPVSDALFEAHRRYADIQVVLSGRETLLWAPLVEMKEDLLVKSFDEAKDMAKWKMIDQYLGVPMLPGRFVILFPEDAHAPGVHAAGSTGEEVLKVVFKVALD